jgi:hypothetical protein
MSLRTYIFGGFVLFGATLAGYSAALQPQVTVSDVIEGMRQGGVAAEARQVNMPSTVPARMEHPALEALKIEPLSSHTSRVLMRCTDRVSCIPFYAVVNGLAPGQQLRVGPQKAQSALLQSPAQGPVIIKRGSSATLEIVAPEMLITVPVVCLQNGRQGERIRVSSLDQKNTYQGEVISPGVLRSRL